MPNVTKTVHYGPTKTGLKPTISARGYHGDGTVATPVYTGAADEIEHEGFGAYRCRFAFPGGFIDGYIEWTPGDGSRTLIDEVNIPVAAAEVTLTGVGANEVTVTVVDDDTPPNPLQDISVTVLDASGTTVRGWFTTNSDGQIVFMLDNGDYKVNIRAGSGYVPLAQQDLTVNGVEDIEYVLERQASDPPPGPGLCDVEFFVVDDDGEPVVDASIRVFFADKNVFVSRALLSAQRSNGVTDEDGRLVLRLVQGGEVTQGDPTRRAEILDPNGTELASKEFLVPDIGSANFEEILAGEV
jgi:hypothetical protein